MVKPLAIFVWALFLATAVCSAGTKPTASKKAPINQPVMFKAVEIKSGTYAQSDVDPGWSQVIFCVKSENLDEGIKIIKNHLTEVHKILGFVEAEKSYFPSNTSMFDTRSKFMEFRVKDEETFKKLSKEFSFFNSRNSGAVSGSFGQIVNRVSNNWAKWMNGYTVFKGGYNFSPIGKFKYGSYNTVSILYDYRYFSTIFLNNLSQSELKDPNFLFFVQSSMQQAFIDSVAKSGFPSNVNYSGDWTHNPGSVRF